MKRLLAVLLVFMSAAPAYADTFPTISAFKGSSGTQTAIACDKSAVVNIAAAATTAVITATTGKAIYVCGFSFTVAGTTPTVKFEYGTKTSTDCDTGATALTGAYAPTSGSFLASGIALGDLFSTPASNELCLVTTGTSPSVQGVVTYALF